MRVPTRLMKSGSSQHVTIPKQILEYLEWPEKADLFVIVQPDKSLRLVTTEQYILERIGEDRRTRPQSAAVGSL